VRESAVKSGRRARECLGYFMKNATHFYVLAGLVGMVQGGTQAPSRSLFASM
jgi:MFS transporter, UMF1 family